MIVSRSKKKSQVKKQFNCFKSILAKVESTSNENNEMVQLFHQLESQQLANYILKTKIESLKASLYTTNQRDIFFAESPLTSLVSRSVPTTPTQLVSKETMLQNFSFDKNKEKIIKNLNNTVCSEIFFRSKDDLELNKKSKTNINKFKTESRSDIKSFDTKYDKSRLEIITKNAYIPQKIENTTNKNQFKQFSIQNKSENYQIIKVKELNKDGNSKNTKEIATSTAKTPKSALLDKRRKAVFELLTHEIYPSGKLFEFD